MAQADYIPAGRTSRVNKGSIEFTLQTEYAVRPIPRLTTSVFSKGQVIYKIEKELENPVSSLEDKTRIETLLTRQHVQALEVVNGDDFPHSPTPADGSSGTAQITTVKRIQEDKLTLADRLRDIDGVIYVIRLDNDGEFVSSTLSEKFKSQFSVITKNLHEILDIFIKMPGGTREQGVYEVERNRLYLVSAGKECYFVLTRFDDVPTDYESVLQKVLYDSF